jgi:16S rRNA (uracil1498-N3)-methyltransferase
VGLRVLERQRHSPPAWRVTLFQALPKGKLFDAIVQKATELGASRIVPVRTERVVPHFDAARGESRAEHWQAVAIEAMKQCGNPWLPAVEAPATLDEALRLPERGALSLVGALHPEARHPREWFQEFAARERRPPASIGVWIGPEGDFSPEELAALRTAGARPVSLGPRVLRVETAAVSALAVVNYELGAL